MVIRVVGKGIPRPVVAQRGDDDFSSVQLIVAAAAAHDVQLIWTLCHYR
jgi:hypothetical protein